MNTEDLLKGTLNAAEPIIQEYVRQLKAEITKLNKQVANFEIENTKLKERNQIYKKRLAALQKALDKAKADGGVHIIISPENASNESQK